jgi:hypothetical protein
MKLSAAQEIQDSCIKIWIFVRKNPKQLAGPGSGPSASHVFHHKQHHQKSYKKKTFNTMALLAEEIPVLSKIRIRSRIEQF